MEITRVDLADLIGRLDAEYYQQRFVDADRRIRAFEPNLPLEDICLEHNRIYIGIAGFDTVEDPAQFTPYLRPADIGLDGEVSYADLPWCRAEWLDDHEKKGCAQPGDLIVEVKGNTRKVAVLDQRIPSRCIVSGSSYRIQLRPGYDPNFVQAYLLSPTGQLLKRRLVSNTAVSYIDPVSFRGMRIPAPSTEAQTYIGNKVRQAAVLRRRARATERSFESIVGIPVTGPKKPARFSRLPAVDIGEDLNPGRYDPDRIKVRNALLAEGGVELASFSRIETPTAAPTEPAQRYLGLDGIHGNSIDLTLETVEAAEVTGTCRRLCQGAAISKLRPYLNKVAYIPETIVGAIGSTELLCVEGDGIHPGFVYGVLKLETTQRQLNPVATGATHPRVSSGDVLEVVVPMHDAHQDLGRSLDSAQQQYWAARGLTQAARLLVEALIERKVTEAELIAAHTDASADRALLERLSAQGFDIPVAPPLFPDLDRLEALLSEARRGEPGDSDD